MGGMEACPVIHLRVTTPTSCPESDQQLLQTIADECTASGVAIVTAKYLDEEYKKPPPRWVWLIGVAAQSLIVLLFVASV